MASKIVGRTVCPIQCGHQAAHVKIKTDKAEGRPAYPYVFCPECGFMCHTKNNRQAEALATLTRPEKTDTPAPVPVDVPTPTGNPASVREPVPAPTPKPARGLFDLFAGASA